MAAAFSRASSGPDKVVPSPVCGPSPTQLPRLMPGMLRALRFSKEAARTLGISQRTVESHRANIMQKLMRKTAPTCLPGAWRVARVTDAEQDAHSIVHSAGRRHGCGHWRLLFARDHCLGGDDQSCDRCCILQRRAHDL